jgi:hypothetical protein
MAGPWESYQQAGPWNEYAKPKAAEPEDKFAFVKGLGQQVMNAGAGALRGAGSIGATILAPVDMVSDAMDGKGLSLDANRKRRQAMDDALRGLGADTDSLAYGAGKLGGEIAGTAGMGGALARGAAAIPMLASKAAPVIDAIGTAGMTAGGATGWAGAGARAFGGAITGGASAGLVSPEDAAVGAGIGAVSPAVLNFAFKYGSKVYNAVKGGAPGAGRLLADAAGVTEAELADIIKAANKAPRSLVPGSDLTLSQALQTQGANSQPIKMLERIVSEGPGGDKLLQRYADQGAARLAALQAQGAQTYQGAAREEATRVGDKIGAIVRTQAGDDKSAARDAWQALYGRASQDGVALHLPLDAMDEAMRPLGRGTVGAGQDARALIGEAKNIGTYEVPPIKFGRGASGGKQESLLDAVKRAGGLNENTQSGQMLAGELTGLRQSGLGRLIYKNKGLSVARMAEKMHEAGFIAENDSAALIDALSNGAKNTFSRGADADSMYRALAEKAMGDAPEGAQRYAQAVPFDEFQRLRRSAGALGAKVGAREGGAAEGGVLQEMQRLLESRADDAAAGNLLSGEVMPEGFMQQYNAARGMTRANAERYKGGNNISAILRKPIGQDYTLTGDEITNKLWHGGAGLAGDVSNLRGLLSNNNQEPAMDALRQYIMTDAASKTTASGLLGAGLPRYVETRMPGLLEALKPEQMGALSSVAADIRNADAAASTGVRGSDTYAKMSRSLDAGILDSPMAKALGRVASIKGVGLESLRSKAAEAVISYKGRTLAELMANPKAAAAALQDRAFVASIDGPTRQALRVSLGRAAPVLAAD